MLLGAPNCSINSSALGRAASLLAVVKAIRVGSRLTLRKRRNGTRMMRQAIQNTTTTNTSSPPYISITSLPSVHRMPRPLLPTVAEIAAVTPIGANIMT